MSDSDNPTFWSASRISVVFSLGVFVNLASSEGFSPPRGSFSAASTGTQLHRGGSLRPLRPAPPRPDQHAVVSGAGPAQRRNNGLPWALALGTLSGLALGPCSFAYSAPVIFLAMQTAATDIVGRCCSWRPTAAGHCTVIIAAGSATDAFSRIFSGAEKPQPGSEKISGLPASRCCRLPGLQRPHHLRGEG